MTNQKATIRRCLAVGAALALLASLWLRGMMALFHTWIHSGDVWMFFVACIVFAAAMPPAVRPPYRGIKQVVCLVVGAAVLPVVAWATMAIVMYAIGRWH